MALIPASPKDVPVPLLLAQTTPTTLDAATQQAAADLSAWLPSTTELLHGSVVAAAVFIVGLAVLGSLRVPLNRLRLGVPFAVAIFAIAFYGGALGLKPKLLLHPADPIALWITRLFAAAMTFVLLRLLDRLALVPLLTRGGKVSMPKFVHQIANIILAIFAILIFGSVAFGWDIDRFLAGSAVVSIVLGLALQETLGNFFSGLVMQASPPFSIGDWIVCGEHEGRVVDMTWRAVTIHTNDDNFILIPNATVAKADIVNFHAPTISTARLVQVGLDYDVPPCDALAVLKSAALESVGVLATPEPFVYVLEFTDAAVLYGIKFWIDNPANHRKIEHAVRLNVWYRLHGRGFGIPFPTFNIEYISTREKKHSLADTARGHRIRAIEGVPLFQFLSADQKRQLADSADDYVLAPGQTLFRQNDPGDSFYIVRKGQVDVLVTPDGQAEPRKVATLGPGDFFGEMSALTGQPRTATIRAATPIALVMIEKQDLHALFEADPSLLEKISEIVARRNAEREAIAKGGGGAATQEVVVRQQKSLLGRMMNFFRLGNAA
jgi:small-conductance mechanosensitive channel/CRP-like cAMP-binding protein